MTVSTGDGGFHVRRGRLYCERVSLALIARRHGTPCYVLSAGAVREAVRSVREAFAEFSPLCCYAMKANGTLAVLRLVAREGCGVEVVSGGELFRALRAGIEPSRIVFSGVGKTEREIRDGLRRRILLFNVESVEELRRIGRVARRAGVRAPVALRVNPHVDAHTHRYITTGTEETKFGIDYRVAERAFVEAAAHPAVRLLGIHTHIGSQILAAAPFVAAARRVNGLLDRLDRRGIRLAYRNIGGGMGIAYGERDRRQDPAAVARALGPFLRARPMRLVLEPGRFVVGEAGALVTRVIGTKAGIRKRFVITDAGMDNLVRPCLYDAYHRIVPVSARRGARRVVDVVGPICESADFLGLGRRLPPLEDGDVLAVLGAGAYAGSMASNYNGRARAAEVLVDRTRVRTIRRRETFPDLVRGER